MLIRNYTLPRGKAVAVRGQPEGRTVLLKRVLRERIALEGGGYLLVH